MNHVRNEGIALSFRYNIGSFLKRSRAEFKAGNVCLKGLVRIIVSCAKVAFSVLALAFGANFKKVKYNTFTLIRNFELLAGGIALPFFKKRGSYLIKDAILHMSLYDAAMKIKRRP